MRPPSAIIINLNSPLYNILTDDWTSCITDQNDILYNHPTIFKIICNILNENKDFTTIVFYYLNTHQRHNVYRTLSYFNFPWNKYVDSTGVNCIRAYIKNCWFIPRPHNNIWRNIRSPTKKIALENLYNDISDEFIDTTPTHTRYIGVTMDDFVKYHIINNKYYDDTTHSSTEQRRYNININVVRRDDNITKKLQLSDMIFDIKDDITDLMFKTIMEKLAEL